MAVRTNAGKKGDGAVLVAPLSVVVSLDERRAIREAAKLSDVSVSAFIRAAAMRTATRVLTQSAKAAAPRAA